MHGVSGIIAIIIILMIAISLAGFSYIFLSSTLSNTTSIASATVNTTTTSMMSQMSVESIKDNKIYVRNVGQNNLSNFSVYVNEMPVEFSTSVQSIGKGDVGTITISGNVKKGDKIRISSPGAEVNNIASGDYEAPSQILYLSLNEGTGNITHDYSGNANDGTIYASGRNQLNNSGFENDKTEWGSSGWWDVVTDEKYDGAKSGKFQSFLWNDTGSNATGYVYINVVPGVPITVSMYSKGSNIVLGSSSWYMAYLIGRWVNTTGQEVCCPDMVVGNGVGTWNWKRSSATFIPPADAVKYKFFFGLIGNASGTLWTDNVQVEYNGSASTFTNSTWETDVQGTSLNFDGINDYVSGTISGGIPTTLNISFRMKFYNGPNSIENPILLGSGQEFTVYVNSTNALFLKAQGIIDRYIDTISNNIWYNVSVGYDGTSYFAYLNGQLKWTQVGSAPVFSSSNYMLSHPSSNSFYGNIDDVRIYNRTFS